MVTDHDIRVGVDTGGTFTDCVLYRENQSSIVVKVPSTPSNPAEGILHGLNRLCEEANIVESDVNFISHGTTVATNAMLQEQWSKVGLITTDGFRDVLEIGTQMRPELYKLQQKKAPSLVPRNLRIEVKERIDSAGEVLLEIEEEEIEKVVDQLAEADVESIAVSFLFSFINEDHEKKVADIVSEKLPGVYVCTSSQISPELREYPRTSTTVINAALAPVVQKYIQHLQEKLTAKGLGQKLHIMQSNGGIMSGKDAEKSSHNLILSGPAGGVVSAAEIAKSAGFPNVLTFDMGGTSSDVGLIVNSKPQLRQSSKINGSYPLQAPTVDVHTIGAGGGSIGWKDHGDSLKVGPQSAGAVPGPACYGKGGTKPTVTDANLYLGRLNAENYLGGEFDIYPELAEKALQNLADEMNLSMERAAWGIIEVANANMVGALRVVSSGKGHDPRDFALVPFGGAGPLHATSLAKELGISTILIPPTPGVLSAHGLLMSDLRHDFYHSTIISMTDADSEKLQMMMQDMETKGVNNLKKDGVDHKNIEVLRSLDLRYQGQEYYLNVPINQEITIKVLHKAAKDFHKVHQKTYGHAAEEEPVEIVNIRLSAIGKVAGLSESKESNQNNVIDEGHRNVFFNGFGWLETPVYRRHTLPKDRDFTGPGIIEQLDTTLIVEPNQTFNVDIHGNIIVKLGDKE